MVAEGFRRVSRTDYVLLSIAALCLLILGVIRLPLTNYSGVIGIVGVVIGVVLGLLGDRWFRYRGKVYCQVEGFSGAVHSGGKGALSPYVVVQSIQVHFFNEKEVDTGLSELTVVFVFESGEEVVLGPATGAYETSTSPRGIINLPSKTWASVNIKARFLGPQATLLAQQEPKAVDIKAKFPGGTPYHQRCLELSG